MVAAVIVAVGAVVWSGRNPVATPSLSPSPSEMITTTPSPSPTVLLDGQYKLGPEKSSMTWQGQKTLIKTWVDRGTIDLKEGSVTVGDGAAVSGRVVVDMTSIAPVSTGRGKDEDALSKHLKSADFFDTTKYPTAEFKLTSLVKDGSSPDGYTVSGTLKLKGVTGAVNFPATINAAGDTLTMKASVPLDRTKWNVRYGSNRFFANLGDNVIDDVFTVTFTVSAARVPSETPSASPSPSK